MSRSSGREGLFYNCFQSIYILYIFFIFYFSLALAAIIILYLYYICLAYMKNAYVAKYERDYMFEPHLSKDLFG